VYRRSLAVLAAAVVAVAVAPVAQGVRVHVRVEGKTQTIFGATEPVLSVKQNVIDALEAASFAGEFYYHLAPGPYVDQIGRYPAAGSSGWVFKVNGIMPPVAANKIRLRNGDAVLWYWATFNGAAGPPTLELEIARARTTCLYAVAVNDAGHRTRTGDVVFALNGHRIASRKGVVCTHSAHFTARVTKRGAVRSKIYSG
jgi:Domain of unknown function (DUF4430)